MTVNLGFHRMEMYDAREIDNGCFFVVDSRMYEWMEAPGTFTKYFIVCFNVELLEILYHG
jgi:hypothetical protein